MRSASRSASLGTPCSASRRAAVQAIASGSVSIKDANLRQAAHLIIREPGKVHITIFHNVGNLHNRAHAFGAIRVDSDKADSFEPPTCASPGYLARKGMPQSLADLAQHELVHYVSTLGTKSAGFETMAKDGAPQFHPMPGRITVNSAEAYLGACAAGLGLIQAPLLGVRELIDRGLLTEVLPHHPAPPMPVTLLYPHRRHLPQRVRVVMDWLAAVVQAHLQNEADVAGAVKLSKQ